MRLERLGSGFIGLYLAPWAVTVGSGFKVSGRRTCQSLPPSTSCIVD